MGWFAETDRSTRNTSPASRRGGKTQCMPEGRTLEGDGVRVFSISVGVSSRSTHPQPNPLLTSVSSDDPDGDLIGS